MAQHETSTADVGQAYFELHHQLHRLVDSAMSAAGLSLARAKVLKRLEECGPMNQARLAGLLGFAPRSVTDTVDALARDGLVERTDDPNDRRARIVSLTPAGHQAYERAKVVRLQALEEIFGRLTPRQRTTLVDLLTTVRTSLTDGNENSCAE
jgi:DNA-binding MarR family transcriptional regulator